MDSDRDDVIYVYRVAGQRDFWLDDGARYWRFTLADGSYRLVRQQERLPAFAVGFCASITRREGRQLARAAARCGLQVRLYASSEQCEQAARARRRHIWVFDGAQPAGYLSLDGICFNRERE